MKMSKGTVLPGGLLLIAMIASSNLPAAATNTENTPTSTATDAASGTPPATAAPTAVATTLSATPALTATPIDVPPGWNLVWHDEFDGNTLDPSNWTYDIGGGGWGNGEAEYYTDRPENVRVENGMLIIEARRELYQKLPFTSARLKTQGLQTFQYGRIEARIKVPAGSGTWPAFWMLGSDIDQRPWPGCGEIDIMEYLGKDPTAILGTMHGPGYSGAQGLTKSYRQGSSIADDFHTYAVEWDATQISWFFDGVKYSTYTRADIGSREWVFNQPFFIMLNMAIGGTLGGLAGPSTVFPLQLQVDYVRVFQKAG